jgi:hypothetical protein
MIARLPGAAQRTVKRRGSIGHDAGLSLKSRPIASGLAWAAPSVRHRSGGGVSLPDAIN